MTSPFHAETGRSPRIRAVETGVVGLVVGRIEPARPARSDAGLLSRQREDEASALDVLFERHWPAVFSYALRQTRSRGMAAGIAQDAFCRFWERRAAWGRDGSVRALLFRFALAHLLD